MVSYRFFPTNNIRCVHQHLINYYIYTKLTKQQLIKNPYTTHSFCVRRCTIIYNVCSSSFSKCNLVCNIHSSNCSKCNLLWRPTYFHRYIRIILTTLHWMNVWNCLLQMSFSYDNINCTNHSQLLQLWRNVQNNNRQREYEIFSPHVFLRYTSFTALLRMRSSLLRVSTLYVSLLKELRIDEHM